MMSRPEQSGTFHAFRQPSGIHSCREAVTISLRGLCIVERQDALFAKILTFCNLLKINAAENNLHFSSKKRSKCFCSMKICPTFVSAFDNKRNVF